MIPVIAEEAALDPGDHLRRLVCFVAAALDVPYAYIAALTPPAGGGHAPGLTIWLARDYGLQFEFAQRYGFYRDAHGPCDYAEALRRIWPQSPGLASLLTIGAPGLPLRDRRGILMGHIAALGSRTGAPNGDFTRLAPLARTAAAKLERWMRTRA